MSSTGVRFNVGDLVVIKAQTQTFSHSGLMVGMTSHRVRWATTGLVITVLTHQYGLHDTTHDEALVVFSGRIGWINTHQLFGGFE